MDELKSNDMKAIKNLQGGGALNGSEVQFRKMAEHAPVGIFQTDAQGDCVYVNSKWSSLAGLTLEQAMGKGWAKAVHPDDMKKVFEEWNEGDHDRRESSLEYRYLTPSGAVNWVMGTAVALRSDDGTVAGYLGSVVDITERKKYEIELSEKETRFKAIFESSADAIMTLEPPSWKFTSANPAMVRIFMAKDPAELETAEPWKLSPEMQPDGRLSSDKAKEMIEKGMRDGSNFFEWTHRRLNGEDFPATVLLSRIELPGKTFLQATVRDITEQKLAEVEQNNTHKRLLTVLDSLDAIVYVADIKTHELLFINKYVKDIFGDIVGQICWKSLQSGQSGPCTFCTNDKLLDPAGSPKGVYHWELQNTVNGHWYDIRDRALKWIDGRIVRMEIAMDITNRKDAEEALLLASAELEKKNKELQEALAKVKTLSAILPICSYCKKIRDDKGYWDQVEVYLTKHTDTLFSHGMCPDCAKKAYAELKIFTKDKKTNSEDNKQQGRSNEA